MPTLPLSRLIDDYKQNPNLIYQSWFLHNEDRLKAFRSIRRGVLQVVSDIKDGSFPNDFKGSSLEFVLSCITEQKQIFEGASHPFYWKPKLRIPDIYENQEHKRRFEQFLECCLKATTLYLVVPDSRRKEVEMQFTRPSIRQTNTQIRYILMSELRTHCDALCRFGDSHRVLEKIARAV